MKSHLDQEIERGTVWVIALGILLILAGVGAIAVPLLAPRAVAVVFAWIFLVGGIIRVVQAFQSPYTQGFNLKLSIGVLYLVVSGLLFTQLIQGTFSLTLALGSAVFAEGTLESILAFQMRPASNWPWILVSGIVSMVLGLLIFSNHLINAAWLLGVLVGLSLSITGVWFIMLALGLRKVAD